MAVPAPEQIGQACESTEGEVQFSQQCNCRPKRAHAKRAANKEASFRPFVIARILQA